VFRDEGNALDKKNFSCGYALYAFKLTLHLGEDYHFSFAKQGRTGKFETRRKVWQGTGRPGDRGCLRRGSERHRNGQKSQRHLRLCSINTDQLDRAIRLYAKHFDGVLVVSVDIVVYAIVFSEVNVSICVTFCATLLEILDLAM